MNTNGKARFHFMGIGGVGMSALASWQKQHGAHVTGCDVSDSAQVARLRALGIEVHIGHHPEHANAGGTFVSSMAVPDNHPEVEAARHGGLRMLHRIDLLAEVMAQAPSIGITGTHGKSTTTGMVAQIYLEAGKDPSVLLGADLSAIDGNFRYGSGPIIAEVDESDPGFQKLAPALAIVTNLEDDHIAGDFSERRNYHASLDDLVAAAKRFAQQSGTVLYCADWPLLNELFRDLPQARSYGFSQAADYRITDLRLEASGSRFSFVSPDGSAHAHLAVPGRFNAQNAAAALAASHLGGLDLGVAAKALARFHGVGRRWQRRGSIAMALIIDDYAHHPTEIGVTLEAAKGTGRRVRAVLQPHRWIRTARHWQALADAAGLADEVIVLDIYAAGEDAIDGISPELIVARLRASGRNARYLSMDGACSYLAKSLGTNDLVITLGAGDVWKVGDRILQSLGGDDGSA